jgi:hypothetical protein
VYHPYISQALTTERIADWLRAAEARRRPPIAAEPVPARRHRRGRRAHPAARVPGQQAGSGTVAGRPGSDQPGGASENPDQLVASGAVTKHSSAGQQSSAIREHDESGAVALCQTRS